MMLWRKLGWVAVLYFAEGLPFGVVKEVMPVYLRASGVDLTAIGLYSLIGLPWTLKFLWSPLIDRYGDRRLWTAACLLVMAIGTAALAPIDPTAALAASQASARTGRLTAAPALSQTSWPCSARSATRTRP